MFVEIYPGRRIGWARELRGSMSRQCDGSILIPACPRFTRCQGMASIVEVEEKSDRIHGLMVSGYRFLDHL